MSHYKPETHNAISPYLIVNGAQQMVDFLNGVFDAEQLLTMYRDESEKVIMHTEVKIDDSVLMIADSTAEFAPNTTMLHVYVPNVDQTFRKAVEFGCRIIERPEIKEGENNKRGMFEDFAGNQWAIGTQVE